MADDPQAQLYLITPAEFDLLSFSNVLKSVLDAVDVACLRLSMSSTDADRIGRAADTLREICVERDVAIVISDHAALIEPFGLDGIHLTDGARSVRKLRKDLGGDRIVGAFCETSRHAGMSAGEAGADYVAFGPVGASGLGHQEPAGTDLFHWWSEVIEVPVVAEGALTAKRVAELADFTDFFGVGTEIWSADDPLAALRALMAPVL
ncbi:MAG: thiamine phosphate synthase [Pseudomonadota bacterium]